MHKLFLALACTGVVAASGAAGAPLYSFVRAITRDEQFRHDRSACIAQATVTYEGGGCTTGLSYASNNPSGPPQLERTTTCNSRSWPVHSINTPSVIACMQAKGYQRGAPSMPAGRPGLYELRKFTNLSMAGRPYIAAALPFAQRRASEEALAQPGPVLQLCVPPDGTEPLGAVAGLSASCAYSNIVDTPHGFAADARCQAGAVLHIMFDTLAPDRSAFTVTADRIPKLAVPRIDRYEFARVSADCGNQPPRTVRMPDGKLVAMAPAPATRSFETTLP